MVTFVLTCLIFRLYGNGAAKDRLLILRQGEATEDLLFSCVEPKLVFKWQYWLGPLGLLLLNFLFSFFVQDDV